MPIYLGSGTSNFFVIGESTKTMVYDEGTNNLIVGVNNTDRDSPVQTLADTLAQKRDLISYYR